MACRTVMFERRGERAADVAAVAGHFDVEIVGSFEGNDEAFAVGKTEAGAERLAAKALRPRLRPGADDGLHAGQVVKEDADQQFTLQRRGAGANATGRWSSAVLRRRRECALGATRTRSGGRDQRLRGGENEKSSQTEKGGLFRQWPCHRTRRRQRARRERKSIRTERGRNMLLHRLRCKFPARLNTATRIP